MRCWSSPPLPLLLSGVEFLADGVLLRCWSSPPLPPSPPTVERGAGAACSLRCSFAGEGKPEPHAEAFRTLARMFYPPLKGRSTGKPGFPMFNR